MFGLFSDPDDDVGILIALGVLFVCLSFRILSREVFEAPVDPNLKNQLDPSLMAAYYADPSSSGVSKVVSLVDPSSPGSALINMKELNSATSDLFSSPCYSRGFAHAMEEVSKGNVNLDALGVLPHYNQSVALESFKSMNSRLREVPIQKLLESLPQERTLNFFNFIFLLLMQGVTPFFHIEGISPTLFLQFIKYMIDGVVPNAFNMVQSRWDIIIGLSVFRRDGFFSKLEERQFFSRAVALRSFIMNYINLDEFFKSATFRSFLQVYCLSSMFFGTPVERIIVFTCLSALHLLAYWACPKAYLTNWSALFATLCKAQYLSIIVWGACALFVYFIG